MVKAVRRVKNKSLVARVFGVARKTVWSWCNRAFHRGRESFKNRRPRIEDRSRVREKSLQ